MNNLKKLPVIGWLLSPGFPQGAMWAVLTCFVSVSNDVITKLVGTRLDGLQIGFFRYLFSLITILPFMIPHGVEAFKTKNPKLHFWRGVWGVVAITLFIFSLIKLPLPEVTTLSFTQPLWFMPLAFLFLREKIHSDRWIAAIVGFVGIVIIVRPASETFNIYALLPIAAAFCFGCLDILAKKMVTHKESTMTMLFYFALATTVAGLAPAIPVWQTPTMHELFFLFLLGAGANLIQVCLFRAFAATDASSLAPFRYVDLVFSIIFSVILFNEFPTLHTMIGAAVIIASTLYLSYREAKRS
jgi:S-adenosylmethionine uptake transporter